MIPRKIHYCWFGGNELPARDRYCIESWKKMCPDYEIIRWDESNYDISKCAYMKEAYEAKRLGFVPDYARLDIIYEHGGIYLDTDVELIRNLDDLLTLEGFAGFEASDQTQKCIALGLGFGAQPHNEIIRKLRDDYDDKHFMKEDGQPNLTAAPVYSTALLRQLGLIEDGANQSIDGFQFFSEEYFCPKSCVTDETHITENTYSIHHYNASWFTEDERKRAAIVNTWKKRLGKQVGTPVGTLVYYITEEGVKTTLLTILRKVRGKKND